MEEIFDKKEYANLRIVAEGREIFVYRVQFYSLYCEKLCQIFVDSVKIRPGSGLDPELPGFLPLYVGMGTPNTLHSNIKAQNLAHAICCVGILLNLVEFRSD